MSRRRVLVIGHLAGAVSVILALYVGALLGPVAVDDTEVEAVIAAATEPVLSAFPSGTAVYVQSSARFWERRGLTTGAPVGDLWSPLVC
jgi:hypothetical protein